MTSRERGTGTKHITVHAEGVEKSVGWGRKNVYRGKRHHGKREWLTAEWDPRWVNASGVEIGSRGSIDNKSLRCSRSLPLFAEAQPCVWACVGVCCHGCLYLCYAWLSMQMWCQEECSFWLAGVGHVVRLYCRDLCLLGIMER